MRLLLLLALMFAMGCDTVKYNEPVVYEEEEFSLVDSGGTSGLRSRAVSIPGTWHKVDGLQAVADIGTHPVADEIVISYRKPLRKSGLAMYSFTQNSANLTKLYDGDYRGNPAHGVGMDRDGIAWGVQYGMNYSVHTNILRLYRVSHNLVSIDPCYKDNPLTHKKSPAYNAIDIAIGAGTTTHTGNDLLNRGIIILGENGEDMYQIKSPLVNRDFMYDTLFNFIPGEFVGSRIASSNTSRYWKKTVIIDNKNVYRHSYRGNYHQYYDGVKSQDVGIEPIRFLYHTPTVWMIGKDTGGFGGRIYMRNNTTGTWEEAGGRASRVAVDQHGRPWIVNKVGHVFCWY